MNLHSVTANHLAPALKKHYQQLLLPFERFRRGLDSPPAALAARPAPAVYPDAPDAAGVAAPPAASFVSSGGSLMSRRGQEVVTIKAAGDERSNGDLFDEVIAYEPPKPGEEMCEVCGSGDDNDTILLCDKCNCGFHMRCLSPPLSQVVARTTCV